MDISKLQPESFNHIQSIVDKNRIGNAYLIHGPSGSGKEAFALTFGSLITGFDLESFINNPNIFLILPGDKDFYKNLFKSSKMDEKEYQEWNNYWKEKLLFPLKKKKLSNSKRIPINVLKNLKKNIFFKSDRRKVVIIFDAHALSEGSAESANALLKILEEPPNNTSFLLVSESINQVVPTISSRCQTINIPRIESKNLHDLLDRKKNFDADILSFLSNNNLDKIDLLDEYSKQSILEIVNKYIDAIQYHTPESVSFFSEDMILNFNSKREKFYFELSIIKKWLECTLLIQESISLPFHWNDFTDLGQDFLSKNSNSSMLDLLKEIEICLNNLKANSAPKLSIMNMIINSHNSLN